MQIGRNKYNRYLNPLKSYNRAGLNGIYIVIINITEINQKFKRKTWPIKHLLIFDKYQYL